MNFKNSLLFTFALLSMVVFTNCGENASAAINAGGTTVKGQITNASNLSFYLDKISFSNDNDMFPKQDIDANGNFQMDFDKKLEAGIYRMRIGTKRSYMVLDGSEKLIEITGDLENFQNYDFTLKGAPVSSNFQNTMRAYKTGSMDKAGVEKYIKGESNALAAAFTALSVFSNDYKKMDLLKSVGQNLNEQVPGSKYASDFATIVGGLESKMAMLKANELVQVGLPAPEIKLPSPDGKDIALSDLKGKIVLLDFWASWCGPCRKANPHVVETYKKYKDQGFTVYSVSLDGLNPRLKNRFKTEDEIKAQMDAAKKRWTDAIVKDKLEWEYHVSDLQYWQSIAAKTYGVRSIPQTFLIDREGKIAAINPRYNLEEAIKKEL